MKALSKQKGFTLIELVVVIVILGILAATAAPKFIDLTSDAKSSVVSGLEGAINSAADLAYAKALVQSQTQATGAVTVPGAGSVTTVYGWPNRAGMESLLEVDLTADGDFVSSTSGSTGVIFTHRSATTPADCYVVYDVDSVSALGVRPDISSVTSGC